MSAPAEVEIARTIGAPVARKEDKKLLQGQAQWVDNMEQPGMVFLGVVRSPYAHARIKNVNVDPALAHAGVVAAWTGADIADEWHGSLPCAWIPTEDEIRHALEGNICRCTGYQNIIDAIEAVAR